MRKEISVLNFIRTGKFGSVQLGMNEKEVIDALGNPENEGGSEDAFFYSYGWWEIHFLRSNSNRAYLIKNDQLLYDCSNHDEMLQFENKRFKIELNFIQPFQSLRLGQIIAILNEQNISFNLVDEAYQPILQLESKVYMDFTDSESLIEKTEGFYWAPGRNQELKDGAEKIKKSEDLILYTIGISNLKEI